MEMEKEGDEFLENELKKFIKDGYRVCEIGSGYCYLLKELISRYKIKGYGVDPYGDELEKENLKCFRLEAEKISSLKEDFDIIYSIRSFHHIKWPELFIEGAYKRLFPGGYLITVDWKWGTDTGINERYYSIPEIEEMYTDFGFKILTKEEGKYNFCITGKKV